MKENPKILSVVTIDLVNERVHKMTKFNKLFDALAKRNGAPIINNTFILPYEEEKFVSEPDARYILFFIIDPEAEQLFVRKDNVRVSVTLGEAARLMQFSRVFNMSFSGNKWNLHNIEQGQKILNEFGITNDTWDQAFDLKKKMLYNQEHDKEIQKRLNEGWRYTEGPYWREWYKSDMSLLQKIKLGLRKFFLNLF